MVVQNPTDPAIDKSGEPIHQNDEVKINNIPIEGKVVGFHPFQGIHWVIVHFHDPRYNSRFYPSQCKVIRKAPDATRSR